MTHTPDDPTETTADFAFALLLAMGVVEEAMALRERDSSMRVLNHAARRLLTLLNPAVWNSLSLRKEA